MEVGTELGSRVTLDAALTVVVGAPTILFAAGAGELTTVPLGKVIVLFQIGQRSRHASAYEEKNKSMGIT